MPAAPSKRRRAECRSTRSRVTCVVAYREGRPRDRPTPATCQSVLDACHPTCRPAVAPPTANRGGATARVRAHPVTRSPTAIASRLANRVNQSGRLITPACIALPRSAVSVSRVPSNSYRARCVGPGPTAVPSPHAANGNGRGGGTAVNQVLRATGQPLAVTLIGESNATRVDESGAAHDAIILLMGVAAHY